MKHINGPHVDLSRATWRKSSYSGDQGNCVEIADGFHDIVPVRDSKTPTGPSLLFSRTTWAAFTTAVKPE
ncbi:DUF397 domain-containing protein [Streptomyces sp. NPDC050085]|uniref:DUF397 domain-containing protein n=1 Tax=Streptomyces sp. NPDC050085 TaxID=3365600 RepID=UPI0037A48AFA